MNAVMIVLTALIGFIVGAMSFSGFTDENYTWHTDVVAECEKELPRHLHCEPVITAKVVEEQE